VSAELTFSSHCSVPSKGKIAETSWIPPVSVPTTVVVPGMEHEVGHSVEAMAMKAVEIRHSLTSQLKTGSDINVASTSSLTQEMSALQMETLRTVLPGK